MKSNNCEKVERSFVKTEMEKTLMNGLNLSELRGQVWPEHGRAINELAENIKKAEKLIILIFGISCLNDRLAE